MFPDPRLAAALHHQQLELARLELQLAARAASPPTIGPHEWSGTAAQAQARQLATLRRRISAAHDAVAEALATTRHELASLGG